MTHFLAPSAPDTEGYVDRRALLASTLTEAEFKQRRAAILRESCTLYVGGLSLLTTETQIAAHFSLTNASNSSLLSAYNGSDGCGGDGGSALVEIYMGLNETTRRPCGFCFVVYESPAAARRAAELLHRSVLDDRVISVSADVGVEGSRRFGRGAGGGQVVDGIRQNVDLARGGFGVLRRAAAEIKVSTIGERATTAPAGVSGGGVNISSNNNSNNNNNNSKADARGEAGESSGSGSGGSVLFDANSGADEESVLFYDWVPQTLSARRQQQQQQQQQKNKHEFGAFNHNNNSRKRPRE